MNGETTTQPKSATGRIEPTAADVRDIAQAVVDKVTPLTIEERLRSLEKSHVELITKLSRHFPALF